MIIIARIHIHIPKIIQNIETLYQKLNVKHIDFIFVVKLLSGNLEILLKLLQSSVIDHLYAIGDSRLELLKIIKQSYHKKTILIRPPSIKEIQQTIEFCDYSHNTDVNVVTLLNKEAKKQHKVHNVFLMIECGDGREGIYQQNIRTIIKKVLSLSHINLTGIGSNFGCLKGISPSLQDLQSLSNLKSELNKEFNLDLRLSAGASNCLPMYDDYPFEVDLLRIGEAIFLGTADYQMPLSYLNQNSIRFYSNVLQNRNGEKLLDFGEVDVPYQYLKSDHHIVGSSSDMTVIKDRSYQTDFEFGVHYKAIRHLMVSPYVKKICEG